MAREQEHEELEMGEREEDAFIPGRNTTVQTSKLDSVLTRWIPPRIRMFLENLSRLKLVTLILVVFILLLALLSYLNNKFIAVKISPESTALVEELAKNLSTSSIPDYVLEFAPMVFLDKADRYYPSDLATHVSNTHPAVNFTTLTSGPTSLDLNNLDKLNDLGGKNVYLTSTEPLVKLPKFLHGQRPDKKTLQTKNAISCVIIVVDKGKEIQDAFYMYFYTFNKGPTALLHEVGNHLGDWEHNMIRFVGGMPQAVWYSQHEYGAAYSYSAVRKVGKRPVVFSARGSHANYAKSGSHDLHEQSDLIPANIAYDRTSQGRLWDPTLSAYFYTYSPTSNKFTPAVDGTPENYLYFQGQWGDEEYADGVEGQESFHGFHKWTGGPRGPLDKHLDRVDVCLTTVDGRVCDVRTKL